MWPQPLQTIFDLIHQPHVWGLLISFAVGLIVGRVFTSRKAEKVKTIARKGDEAFFKGIRYILSNDHDQAIEQFTKAVQVNSDTVETYMALGNLYRSRGDIERAIRIRQNIILRPHIDDEIKMRALLDLGMDYRKGGLINRALENFLKVLQFQPSNFEALEELEKIYEDMKDWGNAFAMRQKIAALTKENHSHILAHHQTEMGKNLEEKGDLSQAKSCYKKAISIDEKCIDAYLHLGDIYFIKEDLKEAIATWKKVVEMAPQVTFLALHRLEEGYASMQNLKPVEDFLIECAGLNLDPFTHVALARYRYMRDDYDGALHEIKSALALDPSFWEARKLMGEILLATSRDREALAAYKELIGHLNIPYLKFQCSNCGFRPPELLWQCPQCRKWDTMTRMEGQPVPSVTSLTPPKPDEIKHPAPWEDKA